MTRTSLALASIAALAIGTAFVMAQQGPMRPGAMMGGAGPMMPMAGRTMPGMSDCPMMGMMMGNGDMPAIADGRIAFLKAELTITAAQQTAWDTYAGALRKNFTGMQAMRQTMMSALDGKTPVERLDAHLAAIESRHGALKEIKPVLATLYGALNDEQKKKADQILTGMGCMM